MANADTTNKNLLKIHKHDRQIKASEEMGVKFMQVSYET